MEIQDIKNQISQLETQKAVKTSQLDKVKEEHADIEAKVQKIFGTTDLLELETTKADLETKLEKIKEELVQLGIEI